MQWVWAFRLTIPFLQEFAVLPAVALQGSGLLSLHKVSLENGRISVSLWL